MLRVSSETFSQILLSHGGIEFGQNLVPSSRRMLNHDANKTFGWPSEISVIVRHPTHYRINKGADSPLDQFGSLLCDDGQGYTTEVPTQVVVLCEAQGATRGQMREADVRYHQHQTRWKMHDH